MNSENFGIEKFIYQTDPNSNNWYTMFDLKIKHNQIYYWENVISYEKELVNLINSLDNNELSYSAIPKWDTWTASNDLSYIYGKTKFINTKNIKLLTENKKINRNVLYIINSLIMAPEMCALIFAKSNNILSSDINLDLDHIRLNKYNTGMGMGPHADDYDGSFGLKYSLVTYLNDDYDGGEIDFPEHNLMIKPKSGSLVMFPSTYVHEAKPITSGNKYMYTTHWKK